jgi:ABC-type spermidine/putrescine transport system permease subunit II
MVIGTEGFVAWFEAIIYNRIRKACKNILIRILVHLLGLSSIVIGLYFLIAYMPSGISIGGLFLSLIGFVIFFIPIGVNNQT